VINQPRRQTFIRLLVVNVLLLTLALLWNHQRQTSTVAVAVAKAKQMMDMPAAMMSLPAEYALDTQNMRAIATADRAFAAELATRDYVYLSAAPLSEGEARYWQADGCARGGCAHALYYDYAQGGALEAIVDLTDRRVVASWRNESARPGGSSEVMPAAMAIAGADPQVQAVLGDIGAADPAMIPMSGWLADDACAEDYCVDLSFHDPAGTGRIVHVFVNLQTEQVARLFYTRGREDRSAAKPLAQRNAFNDGCHEQYGWNVCWEMTANDGINFQDATYNSTPIFASAKIGQIEAWYPSWPGGYRDEIGFAASVPPFGGTIVTDLDGSFEVRQVFTEFTRWPNCICCYRYEQVIQFYEDGRFEPRFVSNGPGCDDLSIYRPFWRIDLTLDGPGGDEVWLWDRTEWVNMAEEFETFPIVDDLSPDGYKLATFDGDVHYRWTMERTDPLGLDEGYLFLLARNENEGEGPIVTGPGDTFIPPRQWINGDALSGGDPVLWFVPLLKTKKGGPWWCMPDPDPDFSPCEAVLVATPGEELRQPTAEELAAIQAAATPTPEASEVTPTAAPSPTPRAIEGQDAETIILNAGCSVCHVIGDIGEAHKVGPDLSAIGFEAGGRVAGMSAAEYIHQSIVEPNAYLAPLCPNGPCLPNIMPRDYSSRLSDEQLDTLVAFLLTQTTPSPATTTIGEGAPLDAVIKSKASPSGKLAPQDQPALPGVTPVVSVQLLVLGLILAFSVLIMLRRR
jgi:hypothetical protein